MGCFPSTHTDLKTTSFHHKNNPILPTFISVFLTENSNSIVIISLHSVFSKIQSMDTSNLQSRIYSNVQSVNGLLGIETPHHNYNRHSTPAPALQMVAFSGHGFDDDDDEQGASANEDLKRKASQWHRMKWTDTMVKLLIMAVYYIGDEAGTATATTSSDNQKNTKPTCSSASAAAGLQKKGKWKSVSKAMMEKGYCVSPQQCEDKFNDLNKRYKRVNDILGRGTACRVVENQSLLDSMDLAPKLKEEARKLLNSKHLFFREMCAYHNSCANPNPHQHHSPAPNSTPATEIESEGEEEEDELEISEDDWEAEEEGERKRGKMMEMKGEVLGVIGDVSKTVAEKRVWMMGKMVELEEEGVKYQAEALEIEKQRWKWARYCRKKEMEMEKKKVVNERMRLENQRLTLLLRQKEIEFL